MYSQIVDLLSTDKDLTAKVLPKVVGSIFDSSPNNLSGNNFSYLIRKAPNAYNALTLGAKSSVYKAICYLAVQSYASVTDVQKMNEDYHKRLTSNAVKTPQLYLYSYLCSFS